jgi:hypothetical protein
MWAGRTGDQLCFTVSAIRTRNARHNFYKKSTNDLFSSSFAYFPKKGTRCSVKSLHRLGFSMALLNANGRDNFARTAFSDGKMAADDARRKEIRGANDGLREHRSANGVGFNQFCSRGRRTKWERRPAPVEQRSTTSSLVGLVTFGGWLRLVIGLTDGGGAPRGVRRPFAQVLAGVE